MRAVRTASASMRWADYVGLPDDDRRELVDGRLVEGEMPTKWHEAMVAWLVHRLWDWCERRELRVLPSGYKVRITDRVGVMPDVQVLEEATYRAAAPNGLQHATPRLVIEIISPTSRARDRVRKVDWYARLGVPEYWLIDVDARCLERLVLDGQTYRIAQHAAGDEAFRPRSMRGLTLKLGGLWALLD